MHPNLESPDGTVRLSSKRLDVVHFGRLMFGSPDGNSIESRKLTRASWMMPSTHALLPHLCTVTNVKYASLGEKGISQPGDE